MSRQRGQTVAWQRDDLLTMSDEDLLRCCRCDRYRASGPGGQHRNKTESAVRLTLADTDFTASCADSRSQHQNRRRAVRRLRLAMALEWRAEADPGHVPADHVGRRDARYPLTVARWLDLLEACDYQVGTAARQAGSSTGRLVRFLAADAALWTKVNRERERRGMQKLSAK